MPTFNFSFIKKDTNKRKTNKNNKEYEVLKQNVIGVVNVTINAIHQINVDGNIYNIKHSCYSCKGKDTVYRIGHNEVRPLQYIRVKGEYKELDNLCWLPFAVGCIVKGNIVRNTIFNITLFDIKKVWLDYDNEEAYNAWKFYKEHLNEINNVIKTKKLNAT